MTQKGVDAENAKTGGNLQTAVTTPPSKLKAGSKAAGRRKSHSVLAPVVGMEKEVRLPAAAGTADD